MGSVTETSLRESANYIETRLFINGSFVDSFHGKKFRVVSPTTNRSVAEVFEATEEDVESAVQSAKRALPAWSSIDASERRRCLNNLADLIEQHVDEFAYLEAVSMGKPISAYGDASVAVETFRYYAGKAYDIQGVTSLNSSGHLNLSIRQPYGITAAIIPWNVPLIMMSMKIGPSLAAGNCLILKSSEKAPLTALLLARLSKEAGIPDGVLNILSGFGRPCGDALARHPEIRKIAFTGSVATGKLIQKAAAESNLKSCTLELGGKSPLIVFEDADLAKAAQAAAHSITVNSGQVCMASSRVYVHESVAERFATLYKEAIESIGATIGDPLDPKTMYGPVADHAQAKGIASHLQSAREQNCDFLLGGPATHTTESCFIRPVVLGGVPRSSQILRQEIFGPVACLNTFTTEQSVLDLANDTEYGLYASIFTLNINRAIRMAKGLESGSVAVNTSSPYYPMDLPLGGAKGSGTGREMGQEGLDAWSEVKSVYFDTT
ncbi:hypothetical protein RBB50_006531 [Rhinocladiella similis]